MSLNQFIQTKKLLIGGPHLELSVYVVLITGDNIIDSQSTNGNSLKQLQL